MIKEAINKILELAAPVVVDVGGVMCSGEPLFPVVLDLEPPPAPLVIHSLAGLVDYIRLVGLEDGVSGLTLVVEDYNKVVAYGPLEPRFGRRKAFCVAKAIEYSPRFNQFLDPDDFVIELQSKFANTGDYGAVLRLASTVSEVSERTSSDDGVSQQVSAKVGVVRAAEVKLPNPVTLHPYRTFPEIDPVGSLLVFRALQGPKLALFEAGGGKWRVDTIQAVREWLLQRLVGERNEGSPSIRLIA